MESISILVSIKKMLGIAEDFTEFDDTIIVFINSAIQSLHQLGVGDSVPFMVTGKDDTYFDYLGKNESWFPMIKSYLYYKTRLGFDPPSQTSLLNSMTEQVKELEFRIQVQAEAPYIEEKQEEGGENQNEQS